MRETMGAYRLLERTGDDRLGEMFRARDTERGRTASVRVIHARLSGDPSVRAALAADASKAARLSHPTIAALFDVIDLTDGGGELALAHEHVDGKSLGATLGGTPLNARLAVAIGIQIADGLAELHASDLSHGAVDVDHVVVTPRGQAKLIDAGLVRWLSPEGSVRTDDIEALGRLLTTMTGGVLPSAQWASDLRQVIERTRPGHVRRFAAAATLAAELRSVGAMLEARADAAAVAADPGNSFVLWGVLGTVLLALGAWFLWP
ncbi:MAG: protein kinase [Acidobacteriota bacterium]|nr:protein kinase [Acidobacteriota bacterium]